MVCVVIVFHLFFLSIAELHQRNQFEMRQKKTNRLNHIKVGIRCIQMSFSRKELRLFARRRHA